MHRTGKRTGPDCTLFCILLLAAVLTGPATAAQREAAIGDDVPLSGTAIGADRVYLFMTGPGVPPDGSRMDSSNSPVITGETDTFTQVDVSSDRWTYTWRTGRVSGGLAEGKYTVYAATSPVAADALSGVPYSSTDIVLTRPVTTGQITVRSTPPGAQVTVNGRYSGNTPLDLPDLAPGIYMIHIESDGYLPAGKTVEIAAGDAVNVDMVLQPVEAPTSVETSLPETTLPASTIPDTPAGVPISAAVPPCSIMIAALILHRRAGR